MQMWVRSRVVLAAHFAGVLFALHGAGAAEPAPTAKVDFQQEVRPILAGRCWKCHGPGEQEAGLRLDRRDGATQALSSGVRAIVAGQPEQSVALARVASENPDERMPPDGPPLSAGEIEVLRGWIASGAPYEMHWAYAPVHGVPAPDVRQDAWPRGAIDGFVLNRLESSGLSPASAASPAVLMRRLYYDLHGLPPDETALSEFSADHSPEAYERLVDRLLASPRFGERFARHWLDVVRYAESVTLRGLVLGEAWRYRDYVIESFNSDRPYDEFLREQIAGDLEEDGGADVATRQRRVVATMFWALGNINLEEQDKRQLDMDVVDEQLDVLGKAVLGQTIGCARCHDHKFDPIPTRDYYALAGILRNTELLEHANVSTWRRVNLPLAPAEEAAFAEHEARLAALTAERDAAQRRVNAAGEALEGPAVLQPAGLPGVVIDDQEAKAVGAWHVSKHSGRYIGAGFLHDGNEGQGQKSLTFTAALPADGRYEVRLAYVAANNRATNAQATIFSAEGERTVTINQRQPPAVDRRFVSLGEYRFETAGQSFVLLTNDGADGHVVADAVQFLSRDGGTSPTLPPQPAETSGEGANELAAARRELGRLEAELKSLRTSIPRRPAALTLVERSEISDAPVHFGGSVHTLGEVVPRGFMEVASRGAVAMPADRSGRREMAAWLTSPDNPLTARVLVNRLWHWLFGSGLVATVDNFGSTGQPPTHPELLDFLAQELIDRRFSVKQLVRQIALSQTYRQAAQASPSQRAIDPENQFRGRATRRPLEAEALRDALLMIAGRLDETMGGSTLPADLASDYSYVATHTRRSVYVPVLRNALPEALEAFDFPDTSLTVGQRNQSVVVPQALFMLNNEFVHEQARHAAERLLAEKPASNAERIEAAFMRCLGRGPSQAERQLAEGVVLDTELPAVEAYTELFHLLLASLDFRWRD